MKSDVAMKHKQIKMIFFFNGLFAQTITSCLEPTAMAVISPSRLGTNSWRLWASPGMTPALCVR